MNIKQAKRFIKETVEVYLQKDEYNNPRIPIKRQRPIYLYGPPGIGKTDIMSQVAVELNIGLLDYSMTHHTRQTVIGLPIIKDLNVEEKKVKHSEYTMSEIIASIYKFEEKTGINKGILFLDEINNVSETLHPTMLQLLQFKKLGIHEVPRDWILVVAGNPPIYNSSSRDFDMVTWDRLKRIDLEPDFTVWKEYALKNSIHSAIISYLTIKEKNFYLIETTVSGEEFVTGRSWEDLSEVIKLYEKQKFKVDYQLIVQYLQSQVIARDFTVYYELWKKYEEDYDIEGILSNQVDEETTRKISNSRFDENIVVINLILEKLRSYSKNTYIESLVLDEMLLSFQQIKSSSQIKKTKIIEEIEYQIDKINKIVTNEKAITKSLSETTTSKIRVLKILENLVRDFKTGKIKYKENLFEEIFESKSKKLDKENSKFGVQLDNVYNFLSNIFGLSNEISVFTVEVSLDFHIMNYISSYGSSNYYKFLGESQLPNFDKDI